MAKIIKNVDTVDHTYCGQTIAASGSYTIQGAEQIQWANSDSLMSDIGSGKAQVNNGTSDISGVSNQINFLKDITDVTNDQGYKVFAPTFEDAQGLTTVWKGHRYEAQANSLNIYDEVVTTQLKLRGGWYKLLSSNATDEDYIEFAIVDKDNILGLFDYFGLTVGVDVLELKKFVRTEYICPSDLGRQDFQSAGASEVMAGLYFRTYYLNAGDSIVKFSVTEKYHEA